MKINIFRQQNNNNEEDFPIGVLRFANIMQKR